MLLLVVLFNAFSADSTTIHEVLLYALYMCCGEMFSSWMCLGLDQSFLHLVLCTCSIPSNAMVILVKIAISRYIDVHMYYNYYKYSFSMLHFYTQLSSPQPDYACNPSVFIPLSRDKHLQL